MSTPPIAGSQADKLDIKKGDLIYSINGMNVVEMDSLEVTDFLAKYEVRIGELPSRWNWRAAHFLNYRFEG